MISGGNFRNITGPCWPSERYISKIETLLQCFVVILGPNFCWAKGGPANWCSRLRNDWYDLRICLISVLLKPNMANIETENHWLLEFRLKWRSRQVRIYRNSNVLDWLLHFFSFFFFNFYNQVVSATSLLCILAWTSILRKHVISTQHAKSKKKHKPQTGILYLFTAWHWKG